MIVVFIEQGKTETLEVIDFGVDVVPNIGEMITLNGSVDNMYKVITKNWSLGKDRGIVFEVRKIK